MTTTYYRKQDKEWIPYFEIWAGKLRWLSSHSNFGAVSVTETVRIPRGKVRKTIQDAGYMRFMGAVVAECTVRPESRVPKRFHVTVQG